MEQIPLSPASLLLAAAAAADLVAVELVEDREVAPDQDATTPRGVERQDKATPVDQIRLTVPAVVVELEELDLIVLPAQPAVMADRALLATLPLMAATFITAAAADLVTLMLPQLPE